ncbi:family 20 glycosylhydrolase [Parapedobacter lycopersici]|uniref:family 20 glycosylhydrolase n=1 Tax=Parapedobacter lycopersici TaxID=1864939 RepID=UPI0033421CC1
MKTSCFILLMVVLLGRMGYAQQPADSLSIIKGFSIAAPKPDGLSDFIKFIHEELAPRGVNTLILRVDFNYAFKSHPELRDSVTLSKNDVKKLVKACREHGIQIVPQVNLLGHQSWAGDIGNLLRVYPEFDETPWVKMPPEGTYKWPNEDGLYCKSYCPLHPGVHRVVFALVDEIMDVFEAKAFHAGMDEVFYLGEDQCPRCSGRDKSILFANEVQTIRDHLAERGQELWIWGDRLIDGRATGIGMWAASYNDTYRAIDMIPRDVVICDWQYTQDNQTAVYFALKGLRVVTCAWDHPEVAVSQVGNLYKSRAISGEQLQGRYYGIAHTVWSGPTPFFKGFYENTPDEDGGKNTPWNTFNVMYEKIAEVEQ